MAIESISYEISTGGRVLVWVPDNESSLSDGCGRVWWGTSVPSWTNDLRYYRDVVGYAALSVARIATCATCGGTGRIAWQQDSNKPAWQRRTRKCPAHTATLVTPESVDRVPRLEEIIRP